MTHVYLPIFPLPDVTLFPHTFLPLHVFEARYRAMVNDCLARDRRLAIARLKPGYEDDYEGKPAVYPVAGAGEIVRWERLATGRFNVLVRGQLRVRIEAELPTDTLYRVARATVLPELGSDGPAVPQLTGRVRDLCRLILDAVGRPSASIDGVLAATGEPGPLCDRVTAAVIPGVSLRQTLLEEPDVERRLRRLVSALESVLRRLREDR